ncbi:MAG: amino acid adenylation domain-containing protein [Bacteroidetes bacterium]|nr:amino acid adenylation domain-containing protein [Bacteroidota bacterium]
MSDLNNQNKSGLTAQEKLALLKKKLLDKTKSEDLTFPLAAGQKALYFLYLNSPESTAYNVAFTVRIISELNIPALKKSFQRLLNRDQSLRCNFSIQDGKPVQTVKGYKEIFFQETDLSGLNEAEVKNKISSYHRTPFDLENGDVFKVFLFRISRDNYILLISVHHIACDGWSIGTMLNELKQLYDAESENINVSFPPLQKKYSDYVKFQEDFIESDNGKSQWNYWKNELSGELPYLNLTADKPRPAVQTYNGAAEYFFLDQSLVDKLKKLSKDEGVTLFVTLLSAYFVFLYKYSGQKDIIIGSPTAGRTNTEFDRIIGYFINPVAIRGGIDSKSSFRILVKEIRKKVLNAVSNQDFPFQQLVERLSLKRDPSRSPVFQTFFGMQKVQQSDEIQELIVYGNDDVKIQWGKLLLQPYYLTQQDGQFDITLEFVEGHRLFSGAFKFNQDIFDKETVRNMTENFVTLLNSIVSDSSKSIRNLDLLSPEQKNILIQERNKTESGFDPLPVQMSISNTAALYPDSTAVETDTEKLTYRELDERTDRLADYLIRKKVKPGDPVCICLERSAEMVVAIIGVLKAGAAYIPIDPAYPENRIDHMIRDSGSGLILSQKHLSDIYKDIPAEIIFIDDNKYMDAGKAGATITVSPEDPAYIIYTSGSTGLPKGVLIRHKSLSNHMNWMINEFNFDSSVCVLQKTPFSFDASVWEFYLPLLTGGKLVIAKPDGHLDTAYMKEIITGKNVNVIQMVPSLLKLLLEEPGIENCRSLNFVFSGGEALTKSLADNVFDKLDVTLCNLYGPTEATIDSTFHICKRNQMSDNIPIGRPVSNSQAYILDSDMNPVPDGTAGELYLGGINIAAGYVNNEKLTSEKFTEDKFSKNTGGKLYRTGDLAKYNKSGELVFLGRADDQVKFRGYRIELGEIETTLNSLNGIKSSIVMIREDKPGVQRLTAYLLTADKSFSDAEYCRRELRKVLPDYMIPSSFIFIDEIPYTPNGKIDKKSLPVPDDVKISQGIHEEPEGEIEKILTAVWKEVLGAEKISVNDNFFELGGDSIMTIQIISRANREGIRILPKQIFQFQTIAELAAVVERKTAEAVYQGAVTGEVMLTPVQKRFFEHNIQNQSLFNHSILLSVPSAVNPDNLKRSFRELLRHHDALRLRFEISGKDVKLYNNDFEDSDVLNIEDLSSYDSEEQIKKIEELSNKYNREINIAKGNLVRAVLFMTEKDSDDKLLIIIHHLCVDGISWRILLEDLFSLYGNFDKDEESELPDKTLSFKDWSIKLEKYSKSDEIKKELEYWTESSSEKPNDLKFDSPFDPAKNIVGEEEKITLEFTKEETEVILRDINKAYNTQINDILLTALILAFHKWNGDNKLLLNLEGHGREEIQSDADISRTAGWFTSVFPVLLKITEPEDTGSCIKSVKEILRGIPNNGIGFGLLKYLSDDENIRKKLSSNEEPGIVFNYLGQLNFNSDLKIEEELHLVQDPGNIRFQILEIIGMVINDRMKFDFNFCRNIHEKESIESLAGYFRESMNIIISHCTGEDKKSGFTPSDFTAAGLDQQELDDLLENLNN